MHRFEFDEETLKYFLGKIKERIDEKQSREYYLVEVPAGTENALIVGEDDIDPELIEESGIEVNKSVLIKERFMLEIEFTQEEKEAISYFLESDSAESEIDDRLAGFNFDVMDPDEFSVESIKETLDPNTFYIISKNADIADASHVAFIKDILTSDGLQTFIDTKVNKVEGKTLSEVDFTEDYKEMLDSIDTKKLIMNKDIKDSLESNETDKVLSANQGNVLRVDYMGDHQFEYVDDCEEIYGLTQKQVDMLVKAYTYTFVDPDQEYASLKEVSDARLNQESIYYRTLKERIDEIEARLNHAMMNVDLMEDVIDFYGFQFDFEDQEGQRIGKAKGLKSKDFDSIYPWAGMKRCNLKDGEILCYEGDDTYKEDGSNGDVMVEIPKFYYKVVPVRTEPANSGEGLQLVEAKWMISPVPSKGFKVHPAFIRNGVEVDHVYVGAFEACIFDISANAYLYNDEQVMNKDEDKFASIAGAKPSSGSEQNLTRLTMRKMCKNKGAGYGLYDFTTISAIQLLFIIEYASFDSQKSVGRGVVDINGASANMSIKTGETQGLGSATVSLSSGAISYRGIENLWGNIFKITDGCEFTHRTGTFYWTNDYTEDLAEFSNLKEINFKIPVTNFRGIIDRFGYDIDNDFCFVPTRNTGSSTEGVADILTFAVSSNNFDCPKSLINFGRWDSQDNAGMFFFNVYNSIDLNYHTIGSRIQFYK